MAQSISSNRKAAQQSLRAAAEDLAAEIATLNTLEPAALLQKWKTYSALTPSPLLARIFVVRAIAYRLQEPGSTESKTPGIAAPPLVSGARPWRLSRPAAWTLLRPLAAVRADASCRDSSVPRTDDWGIHGSPN